MIIKNSNGFYVNPKPLLILLLLLAFSCEREDSVAPKNRADLEKHINFLVETTGYPQDKIVYDAGKEEFLIDNDILIAKKEVEGYMRKGSGTANGRTDQRRYTYIVSNAYVTNIKYYVDGSVPAAWRTAITQA